MKITRVTDSTTRRTFCVQAGQAVSFAALGAVGAGCGADSPTAPSQTAADSPTAPSQTVADSPVADSPTAPSQTDGALPTTSGTVAGNVVTVTVDTNSPLVTVGHSALVTTGQDSLLVTRNDQSTFVAVTAICTHKQCTVNGILNGLLVCPCHDSRFTTDGAVVSGPAPTALQTFPTQFAGTTLTITL